jgi:hypothetical protein
MISNQLKKKQFILMMIGKDKALKKTVSLHLEKFHQEKQ